MDVGRQPWDQRASESSPAFQAFAAYRDMPIPRSIRGVASALDKSRQLIGQWSSRHDWQDRVKSWDLEQDRLRREKLAADNIRAAERHAQIAAGGLSAAARVNLAWIKAVEAMGEDGLKRIDFAQLSELMVKVNRSVPRLVVAERLARGMTTESVETVGGPDHHRAKAEGMDDRELDAFLLGHAFGQTTAREPNPDLEEAEADA